MDERLFFARRLGYGLRPAETLEGPVRDWALAQLSVIPPLDFYGPDGTSLRDQLDPDAQPIDNFADGCKAWERYRTTLDKLQVKGRSMAPEDFDRLLNENVWTPYNIVPIWRDCLVRVLTAVNGPSPVFERFWAFWCNHFAINNTDETPLFAGSHTRAIRERMTGTFAQMAHDAILNPCMLRYLDNVSSTGPHSPSGKQSLGNLNENLAREMMELHTLSPAGGYTQADIVEAALALTGWQFYAGKATHPGGVKGNPYGVFFQAPRHEPGKRKILGKTYAPKGSGDNLAPELIADLAANPATAAHLSFKLARHFIADDPPTESVAAIRDVWEATGGQLVAVHTAVVDQVLAQAAKFSKLTSPDRWVIEAFRVSGTPVPLTRPFAGTGQFWIDGLLAEMGEAYCGPPQPNGWSDLAADWVSKEMIDRRVRLSYWLGLHGPLHDMDVLNDFAERLTDDPAPLKAQLAKAGTPLFAVPVLLSSPAFLKM
jgi:uncharacterized protein (DUF1800 family)